MGILSELDLITGVNIMDYYDIFVYVLFAIWIWGYFAHTPSILARIADSPEQDKTFKVRLSTSSYQKWRTFYFIVLVGFLVLVSYVPNSQ